MRNLILFICSLYASTVLAGTAAKFPDGLISKNSVAINLTGSAADSKALVDIASTTRGLLIPRMTSTQRDAISSPTTGLMIFNTSTNSFNLYDGTAWRQLSSLAGTETFTNKTIDGGSNTLTNISLTTSVTGILPVANGGSGRNSLTNHGVLVGATSSAITQLSAAASGTILTGQGSSSDPSFSATPTLGVAGSTLGSITLAGNAAGTFTQQPNSNTISYTINWPSAQGAAATFLKNDGSGNLTWSSVAAGTGTAPTQTIFNATGTQTGWLFTISTSSTVAVGDTYTNNSNTYTVQGALTAQSGQVLYMSGTGATSGTALTRATGSGTSSITFSTKIATATYTPPANVLYLRIKMAGGGGGGAGSGTQTLGACNGGSTTLGIAGTTSFWGANVLFANGGGGGTCGSNGGAGGTAGTGGSGTVSGLGSTGSAGANAGITDSQTSSTAPPSGGAGGNTPYFNGAGQPNGASTGMTANANTGSGGGGAGYSNGTISGGLGSGGGSGGFAEYKVTVPISGSIPYAIGTHGAGGGAGTSGAAGGPAADGVIWIEEYFQ